MLTVRMKCVSATPDDGTGPQRVTLTAVDSAAHAHHFEGPAGGSVQLEKVAGAPFKTGQEYDIQFGPAGAFAGAEPRGVAGGKSHEAEGVPAHKPAAHPHPTPHHGRGHR